MHIELQFYDNVTLIHQRLTDAYALRRHFPFTSIFRYRGAHVDIVRYRYSRTSLQIDRYQVQAVAPCPITWPLTVELVTCRCAGFEVRDYAERGNFKPLNNNLNF